MEEERMALDSLPAAALSRVLDALPPRDLFAVAQTCRALRALADEDARWRAASVAALRAWTHPFWQPQQEGAAAGSWKAAWRRRAALARRVDRVLVATADGSLHALEPHGAAAASGAQAQGVAHAARALPPFALRAVPAARRDVPPAWCPFGERIAYVPRDGRHIFVAALRRGGSGALALTLRLRFPLNHTPIYVLWAHDGATLTWLASAPGQALALHALHVGHVDAEPDGGDEDEDDGKGVLRVLTSDDVRPLGARSAPLFYDLSPTGGLAALHGGDGAARELLLTPFPYDAAAAAADDDWEGPPPLERLLQLAFAPAGGRHPDGLKSFAVVVHGFAAFNNWFQAPAFSADGRFLFHGQLFGADDAADGGASLAVTASRVADAPLDAPHGALPPPARWRLATGAAEAAPGGARVSFAPSPDGRCLALLDRFGVLRIEDTSFLLHDEQAAADDDAQAPAATREIGGADDARDDDASAPPPPPLFVSSAVPGVHDGGGGGGAARVVAFTWAPLRAHCGDDDGNAPLPPPRLLILLARSTPGGGGGGATHRWAVWAPPMSDTACAASAPLAPHNALLFFPSPSGGLAAGADGNVALSETFTRSFLPFADQMWRGSRLWSPRGDAFCYAAAAHHGRGLETLQQQQHLAAAGGTVWVQRVAAEAQQQAPPVALCAGELALWSPC
jgi:hypothetical protein